jgi:hypothetical protein
MTRLLIGAGLLCAAWVSGCAQIQQSRTDGHARHSCDVQFLLDPLPKEVLQSFRDHMVIDGRANAADEPHLAAHWLEYNYAGMDASLDTSWKAHYRYTMYELTHDEHNHVFRCTVPGTSGGVTPAWDVSAVGVTTADGGVTWTYVGAAHSFTGSARTKALGEYHSYYDPLGVANRLYDYLDTLGDPQAPRFLLYTRYARGSWRDTYQRPNRYRLPGWRTFAFGLYADLRRWGTTDADASTADDLRCIAGISCDIDWSSTSTYDPAKGFNGYFESLSREVAYAGKAQILAERVGAQRKPDGGSGHYPSNRSGTFLEYLVIFAESHLREWRTQAYADPKGGRLSPFMFGLTAEFLINFHEWEQANGRDADAYWPRTRWPSIVDGLAEVAGHLYNEAVVESGPQVGQRLVRLGADGHIDMCYESTSSCHRESGAELTALVAPVYGFVGLQLVRQGKFEEARRFFAMGDAMFSAGPMTNVPDRFGKGWFQQYFWSTEYLRFRDTAPQVRLSCM